MLKIWSQKFEVSSFHFCSVDRYIEKSGEYKERSKEWLMNTRPVDSIAF